MKTPFNTMRIFYGSLTGRSVNVKDGPQSLSFTVG
jgi:hypothetical protein